MAVIEVDDAELLRRLRRLQEVSGDLRPAFFEIGEQWVESTKQRFLTKTAPDGSQWAENSPTTISIKGIDDPLVGVDHLDNGDVLTSGRLADAFNYDISDTLLEINNSEQYAAMQQFGGTKSEFPYLWGDIPARPFMGASEDDIQVALDIIERYIQRAIGG